jgi:hypothetical protein
VKKLGHRWTSAALFVLTASAACSKGASHDSSPPSASAAPAVSAVAPREAPAPSAAANTAKAVAHAAWSGSYVAKVGAVEPPKNANEKTWTGDPASTAVGKGAIDLTVDDRGETHGDAKGPLGEMTVSGVYDGKELRANVTPKDPKSDAAMTGFMVLSSEGDALKGTMRVSNHDAKLVREATVELAKK